MIYDQERGLHSFGDADDAKSDFLVGTPGSGKTTL